MASAVWIRFRDVKRIGGTWVIIGLVCRGLGKVEAQLHAILKTRWENSKQK